MKCFDKTNYHTANKLHFWNQHQNLHQIHNLSSNIINDKFATCFGTKKCMQVTSHCFNVDRVGLGLDIFYL